jgi:hypothetical protein
LECRRRTRPALAWLAGASAIATVASKESAMLLPFAVWALDRLGLGRGEGRGALREIGLLGALAAAAVIVAWRVAPPLAGEAYAFGATPLVWLENLLTYCAWVVRIFDPVRDRSATLQPALAPVGRGGARGVVPCRMERAPRQRPAGHRRPGLVPADARAGRAAREPHLSLLPGGAVRGRGARGRRAARHERHLAGAACRARDPRSRPRGRRRQ